MSWKVPLSGTEHPVQLQAGPATLGTGLPAAWGGREAGQLMGKSYLNLSQSESDWIRMQVRFGGGRFWWLGMGTLGCGGQVAKADLLIEKEREVPHAVSEHCAVLNQSSSGSADRRQDNETSLVRRMLVRKMHRDVVGIN